MSNSWLTIWQKILLAVWMITTGSLSLSASEVVALDVMDAIKGAVEYIQVSNISDEQEVEIGKQTNQQVLSQYQLYNNPQIQEYVSNLGQELVSSSDSRNIPFNFQVVASDEVNAFATPGGFVYVTTGLLKTAENRAQLASVMAHEIAHINEKHEEKALHHVKDAEQISDVIRQARTDAEGDRKW